MRIMPDIRRDEATTFWRWIASLLSSAFALLALSTFKFAVTGEHNVDYSIQDNTYEKTNSNLLKQSERKLLSADLRISDLFTSWDYNNVDVRQERHYSHEIVIPFSTSIDKSSYKNWKRQRRRHGKGYNRSGKGKGRKRHKCNGKGKGKGKGVDGKGKGKGFYGEGKGKGIYGKGIYGEGKGEGMYGKGTRTLKGKGEAKGKGGKGVNGSIKKGKGKGGSIKRGKGKGDSAKFLYDYECDNNVSQMTSNDFAPFFAPHPTQIPLSAPAPVITTGTPVLLVPSIPTALPIPLTNAPVSTSTESPTIITTTVTMIPITNAPGGGTTTTGPTPERGLISIRVPNWYIAYRAPDATTRAPNRDEYDAIAESTRIYLEMYLQNYFVTNMLDMVYYVRSELLLTTASYGLDVPVHVPQPSPVDNGRMNIYVHFRYIEFFYWDTSTPIPNEEESYSIIQDALVEMESTYVAQVPTMLMGTPFESTIDIVFDRVP